MTPSVPDKSADHCLVCPNCGWTYPIEHTPDDEPCSNCEWPQLVVREFMTGGRDA